MEAEVKATEIVWSLCGDHVGLGLESFLVELLNVCAVCVASSSVWFLYASFLLFLCAFSLRGY